METISPDRIGRSESSISWGSVVAGSVVAAALAAVLHAFGASVGLATSSSSPTWRDASVELWILTGVYLMLVALASYGLGGYITGWLRSPAVSSQDEETANNIHGLLVWGIATLLTLVIIATTISLIPRLANSQSTPASALAAENLIAYDLDRLLRGDLRNQGADYSRIRGEAGRILLTAGGRGGVAPDDRTHLVRMVNAQTNLTPADSERRVDASIARASESISRARKSTVILGFMASSAILLGLLAAWFATPAGAKHGLDRDLMPIWGRRATTVRLP